MQYSNFVICILHLILAYAIMPLGKRNDVSITEAPTKAPQMAVCGAFLFHYGETTPRLVVIIYRYLTI